MEKSSDNKPVNGDLVYKYKDLIARGVTAKSILDCVRSGLMQDGYGQTETGQRIRLIRITEKSQALMKKFPDERPSDYTFEITKEE